MELGGKLLLPLTQERPDFLPPLPVPVFPAFKLTGAATTGTLLRREFVKDPATGKRGKCNCQRRYQVRYRLCGRAYPVEHGGVFPTMREAKVRVGLIGGELAAGAISSSLRPEFSTTPP
jgi:hypothetical protein